MCQAALDTITHSARETRAEGKPQGRRCARSCSQHVRDEPDIAEIANQTRRVTRIRVRVSLGYRFDDPDPTRTGQGTLPGRVTLTRVIPYS